MIYEVELSVEARAQGVGMSICPVNLYNLAIADMH
jgi:hypothetical protein